MHVIAGNEAILGIKVEVAIYSIKTGIASSPMKLLALTCFLKKFK
jgi:hypothetical protein